MRDLDLQQWAIEAVAIEAVGDICGRREGERATHAKGTICAATFIATSAAAELSRAGQLAGAPVDARVRFSNGSGDRDIILHSRSWAHSESEQRRTGVPRGF
jgi:catalase